MARTIITIRADVELKKQAQELAQKLGLDLSSVINRQLRSFVEAREITFSAKPLIPNKRTAISLRKIEADFKRGDYHAFNSRDETLLSLRKAVRKD